MREMISIHIGQPGVQIGSSCWELYCLEHGIQPDGTTSPDKVAGSPNSIFRESIKGTHIPRSIFIDLDPTTIDEVRTGKYHDLFHPDTLINSDEDSSNCYPRAQNLGKNKILDMTLNQIRLQAEQCDSLQGFIFYHSLSGGTGAGFLELFNDIFERYYDGKAKVAFTVYPSPNISTAVVEPYNALLSIETMLYNFQCSIMFDNESLYDLCYRAYDIERPTYSHINHLISQASSSLTAAPRFDGALNMDLCIFLRNLSPYGIIHFPICSYAPMLSAEKAYNKTMSVSEMTSSVFEPRNMMLKCDESFTRYMACLMMYRGNFISRDVLSAVMSIKTRKVVYFVDWCPTCFKIGINQQPPSVVPGSFFGKFQ